MGRQSGYARALDGSRVFWTAWGADSLPEDAPLAVVVHGYGEHLGRYEHVAAALVEAGLVVVAADMRGHGRSDGERGHVLRYDEYLIDVGAAFDVAHRLHPQGRRALIGHSNGGLIATRYALSESGRRPDVLAVSGPLLGLSMPVPAWKATVGRGVSRVVPALAMPSGIDAALVSHDQAIVDAYKVDPLVHHVATARYFTELNAAIEDTFARSRELKLPTLVMVGGDDKIVDPAGGRRLSQGLGSDDVRFIEYPGMYHEIFNEVERARVLADLIGWLRAQGMASQAEG